jgi:phosphoglucosamine mutase
MKKLFGTDGIRGVANQYPMTVEIALRVGQVVGAFFAEDGNRPKVVIGRDTRLSGDMLEAGIVAGICSAGGEVHLTDVLPTPGVAFATRASRAAAGIVISASHNPYYDNGIKIFKGDGQKLSDATEIEIEKMILEEVQPPLAQESLKLGVVHHMHQAAADYVSFLKTSLTPGTDFNGLKIVLDCSNGATYRVAPQLFAELGADLYALAVEPDGVNINDDCGSQHPRQLSRKVVESGADIGLAFDGDGDRLIAVDETGKVLTGDHILAICAQNLKQKGRLTNNRVVSTVMSNMGFGIALKKLEIDHEVTQVGDRYVMQRMQSCGAVLGGEDSGHMIFSEYHTTGDGILTGLKLIEAMRDVDKPLSEASDIMTVFPQVLNNVSVSQKPEIESVPQIADAIRSAEADLGEQGRVLVRYSGTQPLCRVMVEGPDETETRQICDQLSEIIRQELSTR